MNGVAENETQNSGPAGATPTSYRIHVPRGPELRCLPTGYDSLEAAKRAFERTRGVARWGLVSVNGLGRDDAPRFVLQALAHREGVTWRELAPTAPQPGAVTPPAPVAPPQEAAPAQARPPATIQPHRMTTLLAARLGFFTAEEVVRHVCARFESSDFSDEKQLAELREFLRRGLLGYMEPSAAADLAGKCAVIG